MNFDQLFSSNVILPARWNLDEGVPTVDDFFDYYDEADGRHYKARMSTIQGAGPQGAQGSVGAIGSQGPQGEDGAQGNQGAQGAAGPQGSQEGTQGTQGTQGNQGTQLLKIYQTSHEPHFKGPAQRLLFSLDVQAEAKRLKKTRRSSG